MVAIPGEGGLDRMDAVLGEVVLPPDAVVPVPPGEGAGGVADALLPGAECGMPNKKPMIAPVAVLAKAMVQVMPKIE